MGGFIIIVILILMYLVFKGLSRESDRNNPSSYPVDPKIYAEPEAYIEKIMTLELSGIGPFYHREDAFDMVNVGDPVIIDWDRDNEYDSDAIGVYVRNDEHDLIGYIPRGNQRLIESLLHGDIFAIIKSKTVEPSPQYGSFYRIKVKLWIGFSDEQIEELKTKYFN